VGFVATVANGCWSRNFACDRVDCGSVPVGNGSGIGAVAVNANVIGSVLDATFVSSTLFGPVFFGSVVDCKAFGGANVGKVVFDSGYAWLSKSGSGRVICGEPIAGRYRARKPGAEGSGDG
jgi:hypothetical protein